MAPHERVRTALLAGVTVAALAVGAWWWRDAAPALGPTGPSPSPSMDAFLRPGVRLVDPADQVLASAAPDDWVIVHVEPTGPPGPADGAGELWHERSHLVPGAPPLDRRSSMADFGRYLVTVRCSGPGRLVVELSGVRYARPPSNVRCGEGVEALVVESSGAPLLVRFSAVAGEVDLDARLAQLS